MGLIKELGAKLVHMKALVRMKMEAEARNAARRADRAAKVLTAEELTQGHPKISVATDFQGVSYGVRLGTWFGWFWLIFTCVHCVALFYGMSQGSVKMNGRMITQPDWWHFALLALFYVPFFLVGFAFTVARYRVTLRDAAVVVRWRIMPYIGWTWTLPVGEDVVVRLAFCGSSENKKPVESVVIMSLGKETHFGAFLPADVKEHLAGLIQDYYGVPATSGESPAPFIPSD